MNAWKEVERDASLLSSGELARYLQDHLGQKLTAYLSGLKDPKMVGQWASGKARPREAAQVRLLIAFQAARMLVDAYGADAAKAWFLGTKDALGDEAPAWTLRHSADPEEMWPVASLAKEFAGDRAHVRG
jgi:hypothetical protein